MNNSHSLGVATLVSNHLIAAFPASSEQREIQLMVDPAVADAINRSHGLRYLTPELTEHLDSLPNTTFRIFVEQQNTY